MKKYLLYVIIGGCLGAGISPVLFMVACAINSKNNIFFIVFYPMMFFFESVQNIFNLSGGGEVLLSFLLPAAIVYGVIIGAFLGLAAYFVAKIQKSFDEDISDNK